MSEAKSPFTGSREEQIKAVAYRLWLDEGQPEGRAESHWFKAVDLVDRSPGPPKGPKGKLTPKKPAVSKSTGRKKPAD
jgi:hypothetical protein